MQTQHVFSIRYKLIRIKYAGFAWYVSTLKDRVDTGQERIPISKTVKLGVNYIKSINELSIENDHGRFARNRRVKSGWKEDALVEISSGDCRRACHSIFPN